MPPKRHRPAAALPKAKAKAGAKARPRAKAKVGAKAKAQPRGGGFGRRRGVRRPAARVEAGAGTPLIEAAKVTLEQCRGLKEIATTQASYWAKEVSVALKVLEVRLNGGHLYLDCRALGTEDEDLLKYLSGRAGQKIQVHLCGDDCGGTPHREDLVHVREFRELGAEREGWMSNLVPGEDQGEGPDEMGPMRLDLERRRMQLKPDEKKEGPGPASEEEEEAEEGSKKKKKEKKKKKKKKGLKIAHQKDLKDVLGNTGVDPDPDIRKKFRKRASRLVKRKKDKSDEEDSGSDDSSSAETIEDLSMFGQGGKVKTISKKLPGALAGTAVEEAVEGLLTMEGGTYDTCSGPMPAIFSRYHRQQLQPRMTPAMNRESLTLCCIVDHLLKGQTGQALDTAAQRVKALEMMSHGCHYTVAQQVEVIPKEASSMATTPEFEEAARRARAEGKARSDAARPYGSRTGFNNRGDDWNRGTEGKGPKGQGKGKNQKGDGKKSDRDNKDGPKAKAG